MNHGNTDQSLRTTSPLSLEQRLDIVSHAGIEVPVWSSDSGSVLVVSPLGGSPDVWAFPVNGGPAVRQTSGLGAVGHLASVLPRISPDGKYLSWVTGDIGQTEVWLQPMDGSPAFQLTRIGANINALEWAPDGRWLVVSANRHGSYDIFRISVPDGRHVRLTDDPRYEVYPSISVDGTEVYFVRLDETWTRHTIVAIPVGPDGFGPDDPWQERTVLEDENFFDYHYGRSFGTPTPSPDGTSLLFRSYRSGWINVWSVPVDGGEPRPVYAEDADQEFPSWSPDGAQVVMTSNTGGSVSLRLVGVRTGSTELVVEAHGEVCSVPVWSPDGTRVAYSMATPQGPADLYSIGLASRQINRLTRSVRPAEQDHLVVPELLDYDNEGLSIPAWLYRPESVGVAPNGGGVVIVHGGPTMQWLPTYDGYLQFLVGQGYTVIAPNIRGSSGYGRAFEEANDRDWCGGDLRDVLAAATLLGALPDVDPERLAITGLSYGGIMTMAAVSFAPGVFAAAASLSGYGDFLHMIEEQELRHQQLLRKELGDPVADRAVYEQASAILGVSAATTPALIAHGVGRFPSSEAGRHFAEAMERAYKTVTYRTYANEHYYVTGRDNLRQLWQDVDAFFTTHLDLGDRDLSFKMT